MWEGMHARWSPAVRLLVLTTSIAMSCTEQRAGEEVWDGMKHQFEEFEFYTTDNAVVDQNMQLTVRRRTVVSATHMLWPLLLPLPLVCCCCVLLYVVVVFCCVVVVLLLCCVLLCCVCCCAVCCCVVLLCAL